MHPLFYHKKIKIPTFILFFVSAYITICYVNKAFAYYFWSRFWGEYPNLSHFLAALSFGIPSILLFTLSVLKTKDKENKSLIMKLKHMDFGILTYLSFTLIGNLAFSLMGYRDYRHYMSWLIHNQNLFFYLVPLLAYSIGMTYYSVTLLHIRDRSFSKSMFWLEFFRTYPITKPTGFIMLALLLGNASVPYWVTSFYVNHPIYSFVSTTFSMLAIIGLTYFCRFLLTMSIKYEEAAADKIKSERLKTELITNVSHDLRTPLTSIINYIDLIQKLELPNDELNEYTNVLVKNSTRLKQLTDDLMDASKAGTGNLPVNLKNIDLIELIGQIEGEYDTAFTEKQLSFILNQASEAIAVLADGSHLWRVMANLFSNVAKYAMPQTRIYADTEILGDMVRFSLKNVSLEPLNISPDELTEQFVRGDHSRHTEGSGLGLYIASNLMELMGGRFDILINGDLFEVRLWMKAAQMQSKP